MGAEDHAAGRGPLRAESARRLRDLLGPPPAPRPGADVTPTGLPPPRRADDAPALALPPGATRLADIAYGGHPAQRYDVYRPAHAAAGAVPVVVLVHGGGWQRGDKAQVAPLRDKLAHWLGRGVGVVAVNYRLLPEADPLQQADDVALALAHAQANAAQWGGDAGRFALVGHSAGAHLVLLLAADPALSLRRAVRGWRASVALDSAAFDVVAMMSGPHLPLHDAAFGADAEFWRETSPMHRLRGRIAAPLLVVCSALRPLAWLQAQAFAARVRTGGGRVELERVPLGHLEINRQLGRPGALTDAVDDFLASAGVG
ncbi:MAG: alpha/beta hydrolase [Comamonadaceae bacterium]|nr:alpha/beta hydrolase [Comamonadaceae bacterium]